MSCAPSERWLPTCVSLFDPAIDKPELTPFFRRYFTAHKKGFGGYAARFVDPSMGFALGVNYLLKYLVVTPNNITAGASE